MGWFVDGGCCQNRDLGDFRVPDNRMALDCPYNCHMKTLVPVMLTAVAVLACSGEREPQPTAPDQFAPDQAATIVLAPAFGGLTFDRPVALAFPGDDASRALVVEQPGRILLLTKRGRNVVRDRVPGHHRTG